MSTVEERLSALEVRVDAHAVGLNELQHAVVHLEARMERRFESLEGRFTSLEAKVDRRFEATDSKMDHLTSIVVWAFAAILTAVSALTVGLLLR